MQRFHPELAAALAADETIIVESKQRAAAVRAAYAAQHIAAGRRAWSTPRTVTFYSWAHQALQLQVENGLGTHERLLSEREEWALAREFAQEAAADYEFAARRALASQLRSAALLIDEWQLRSRVPQLRSWPESELLRHGLEWLEARYRALNALPLRRQLARLTPHAGITVRVVANGRTALQTASLLRIGARPVTTGHAPQDALAATCASVDDECSAAAQWSRARLLADPTCRLLIVAPDLAERRPRLERALSQALEPERWVGHDDGSRAFAIEGGRSLAGFALVATALLSLRLLTRTLPFEAVSTWLRSPVAGTPSAVDRARLEILLRESGSLRLSWQHMAALARRPAAPVGGAALADRLQQADAQLPRGKATPIAWAQAFENALRALGWPGEASLRSDTQQLRLRWQELLAEFASLGNVWASMNAYEAVDALSEFAEQVRFDAASDDVPVLVSDALHVPVVAYDGIWVMGLDADTWPPAPRPHPLIPLAWQLEAAIPDASSERLHACAAEAVAHWRSHGAQLVLSSPRARDDAECTPSSLLASLAPYTSPSRAASLGAAMRGNPRFDELADYRGSPLAIGTRARQGAHVFDVQARCPFRAYGELRLGARALERPQAGVDARDRGIWLHEALALFWRALRDSATLGRFDDAELRRRADHCVDEARRSSQRRWRQAATTKSISREAKRMAELLVAGAVLERRRSAFTVEATEQPLTTVIEGVEFGFKIDRIDRLESGEYAIIDYKSGAEQRIDWSQARPAAPQLLAYFVALGRSSVTTIALQFLARRAARYRGASATLGTLPGVGLPGKRINHRIETDEAARAWQDASARWHAQVAELAREYRSGDARVAPSPRNTCAQCHLSALCRRTELILTDDEPTESSSGESAASDSDE